MKKKVISFFENYPGSSFKAKDIARRLGINDEQSYSSLKALLHKLLEADILTRKGKRYQLNTMPDTNTIVGVLQVTNAGYGFVVPKNSNTGDIFIASRNLGTAFNGDTVEVTLFAKQKRKNIEGQIIRVIKRKRNEITGTLQKSNSFYFLKPDDRSIHRDIYVDNRKLMGAKKGDKVIVGNISWDTSLLNPEGEIVGILGKPGSPDTQMVSIAMEFNLPYRFSKNVIDEAEKINLSINQDEIKSRIDLRKKNVFTIDPEDAKDFDDALSVETLGNGNLEVGIHIADVSHFVQPQTELDREAFKRGNSVYLVGTVIPMLPEKISNNICSLVGNEDRLTFSVIAELTPRGKLVQYKIAKTIINSKRRFTYDEAQEIIEKGKGELSEEILTLNNLARVLRKKRVREGSIEFFTPEVKFLLGENGRPEDVIRREIKDSNMLVEEYMLLANRIVAKHIGAAGRGSGKPFVYRVHDFPDREKITEFGRFVKSLGYSFDPKSVSTAKQFQQLMTQVRGTEEEAVVNELAIRSMAKAEYSVKNIGHFGLGFKYYTHFTSPIRRYSDLIVHRLLYKYLGGSKSGGISIGDLDQICKQISMSERQAISAERVSIKRKQIEFLKDHVGEEFHAVISGVTNFGVFIETTEILAEGLVRIKDLEGDFYVYDEKKYALIGKATKKRFRLGDKITVRLVRVDEDKSELDFIILE